MTTGTIEVDYDKLTELCKAAFLDKHKTDWLAEHRAILKLPAKRLLGFPVTFRELTTDELEARYNRHDNMVGYYGDLFAPKSRARRIGQEDREFCERIIANNGKDRPVKIHVTEQVLHAVKNLYK
jgi:hypothetical protein